MLFKYFYYEALIIFQILYVCTCDLENIGDGQSILGLVYVANTDELEFQLKDRNFNDSTKIEPTRLVNLNNNEKLNTTYLDTDNNEDVFEVLWDKNPVPTVNGFYSFDQSAVQILLDFVKLPENVQKLSQKHLQLIKKYISEWFRLIQEPIDENNWKMNEELEIQTNHIPKAMDFQDIVLRNILRVQVDLQKIIDYSNDDVWREQVVNKIIEAETFSGTDIFQEGDVEAVASSLAQLSRTYNFHPFELYPQSLNKDESFLSYVHAAVHILERHYLTVALEWLEAAKSLLKDEISEVWKDILSQNANFPKSLQTEENYWLKLKTKRENFEREREDFAKQEIERLERIFSREEKSGDKIDSEYSKTRNSRDKSDFIYLEILTNVTANIHEELIKGGNTGKLYASFPKPLKEESVFSQSRKEAKEEYIRNFPNDNYDLFIKTKQETLCRGIGTKSTKEMLKYSCRLDSRNSPYLLLMPVKVEELNKDPEMMIFHHIVGDKKIHEFQQMALPIADLSRTGGPMDETSLKESLKFRKSYVAWIHENSTQKLTSLSHVVSHLTGFVATELLNGSESLQINSYVSGGFYVPHQDPFDVFNTFFDNQNKLKAELEESYFRKKHSDGDRLATFMIYMNDDMIGGRTIFPHLGISAVPEKGSAIFWRNLRLNGSIHEHASHAGCQVLAGTKWVANKWIRSNSQMFRKPCSLERNM